MQAQSAASMSDREYSALCDLSGSDLRDSATSSDHAESIDRSTSVLSVEHVAQEYIGSAQPRRNGINPVCLILSDYGPIGEETWTIERALPSAGNAPFVGVETKEDCH